MENKRKSVCSFTHFALKENAKRRPKDDNRFKKEIGLFSVVSCCAFSAEAGVIAAFPSDCYRVRERDRDDVPAPPATCNVLQRPHVRKCRKALSGPRRPELRPALLL